MSVTDLTKAMQDDPCLALAHIVRNDLSALRGLLVDSARSFDQAVNKVQGTMDGLQALIDDARDRRCLPRLIDPAGASRIRKDRAGDGSFGARRGGKTHRGCDTPCFPGDSVRAPMDGVFTRISSCYPLAEDDRFQLVVIEDAGVQVKVLYVVPAPGLVGRKVLQGQHIGAAQDITIKTGVDGLYRDQGMGPHLHTEVYIHGVLVDPTPLMRFS